jgi:hypothetical protein
MVKTIRLPILVGRLRPAAFRSTAIEDKGGRSASTSPAYARAGYKLGKHIQLNLDVVNLFDEKTSDIGYDYQSRLNGEGPDGRNDIHFHRVEPRSFRLALIHHVRGQGRLKKPAGRANGQGKRFCVGIMAASSTLPWRMQAQKSWSIPAKCIFGESDIQVFRRGHARLQVAPPVALIDLVCATSYERTENNQSPTTVSQVARPSLNRHYI